MELLLIKDAALFLNAKERTVRTWISRGQIPPEVIFRIGNTVRIKKDKFEKWIADGSI